MKATNPWYSAKSVHLEVAPHICAGFDISFDLEIPEKVKAELRRFVEWVESNFNMPITLWVDFEYKHYLLSREKKRVGYLFYWSDFSSYPVFDQEDEVPVIRLPVRTEHFTMEEVLTSFIEAITCYFIWLTNPLGPGDHDMPNEDDVEDILNEYLKTH